MRSTSSNAKPNKLGHPDGMWHGLAEIPTWTAVKATWLDLLGPAFKHLIGKRLITATSKEADGHPCRNSPPCGCHHRKKAGTDVMVCDCDEPDCADFTATQEDLTLFDLNTARLADEIRGLLSVKAPSRKLRDLDAVYALGTYHPQPGVSYPVYLIMPSDQEGMALDLASVVNSHDTPVAVILFTNTSIDPRVVTSLRSRAFFVFLDETMTLDSSGAFVFLPSKKDPLRSMHRASGESVAENDLIRLIQVARQLPRRPGLMGPSPLDALIAFLDRKTHAQIAAEYKCSRPLVSDILKQLEKGSGLNLKKLVGRSDDLKRIIKTVEDPRAKKINPWTAATGDEDEDEL